MTRCTFGPNASNALSDQYRQMIDEGYGETTGVQDFCRKAQLVNYTSNKALYEGWLDHMWDDASGVMIWMGQSLTPSMVCQTYDYYDLTGAYWGCRQACEPLSINTEEAIVCIFQIAPSLLSFLKTVWVASCGRKPTDNRYVRRWANCFSKNLRRSPPKK